MLLTAMMFTLVLLLAFGLSESLTVSVMDAQGSLQHFVSRVRKLQQLDTKRKKRHRIEMRSSAGQMNYAENNAGSFIESITCSNLAGVFNHDGNKGMISFSMGCNMVAVTGETGSGKSLLLSKLVDIVSGGKAVASLVPQEGGTANVGMTMCLVEPHLSWVQEILTEIGHRKIPEINGCGRLIVERILDRGTRISSTAKINGAAATIKSVRELVTPLVVLVDAPLAAASLSRPQSRLSVLDSAVDPVLLAQVRDARSEYLRAKKCRRKLQKDLESAPVSISGVVDVDLLKHWIDEIRLLRNRIEELCAAVSAGASASPISLQCAGNLIYCKWTANESSSTYSKLQDFREELRELDTKCESAASAKDVLIASSSESAMAALERARGFLTKAVESEKDESAPLSCAAERAHDHINLIELALRQSAQVLQDDETGLVGLLQTARSNLPISVQEMDSLLSQWNTLARKHGVPPCSLPGCYSSLKDELTGNAGARSLLLDATELEENKLQQCAAMCSELSEARKVIARQLSKAVTRRLPSMGMDGAQLSVDVRTCVAFKDATANGVDVADYLLLYEDSTERGGKLDVVASSGEKARIMLAMECELPGSAGALCRVRESQHLPPIAVLYDEIDAHVGGRAAVSVARMLATQSGQVISITHSPSVAAVADTHLVVTKYPSDGSHRVPITVTEVQGDMRKKELARMASGDLAPDEAENFANALLRDGAAWKNRLAGPDVYL